MNQIKNDKSYSLKDLFLTPKLIPFVVTSIGYFITLLNQNVQPSFFAVSLKCAPVISLMVFAILSSQNGKYTKRILAGQIFCCLGDAFLIFPDFFELGILAFTFGHLHYILAFGWNRAELKKGLTVLSTGAAALAYLLPNEKIQGVLIYGVPIYVVIINIMVWRAIARVNEEECSEEWRWTRKLSAYGAILFAFSDFLIATTMFKNWPNWSPKIIQFLVMITYYLAQLGITVSVLEVSRNKQDKE